MKVLIVDDNRTRNEEIANFLKDDVGINKEEIYQCYNTQVAKSLLRTIHFDYLILDVVLPKRDETPDAKYGLQLLNDIKKRPVLKKPQKIVGITSFVEDIEHFRQKFEEHCEVIIEASSRNTTWKSKIRASLSFEVNKQISKFTSENNLTCLTVHGIRTRGDWQQKLKRIVSSNVDTVSFETYKYGYFTVISFMIPFLRWYQVYKFKKSLLNLFDNDRKIIIFAHSFGTYIAVKAIESALKQGHILSIDKIILSGSVLRSSHDFSRIMRNTDCKIVNDCGFNDNVLLLSEGFVPNTGMAGKVGFYGFNNDRFVNRYFSGGHSHYFNESSRFIEKFWLPLFCSSDPIELVDERKDNVFVFGFLDKLFSLLGKVKEVIYIALLTYLSYLLLGEQTVNITNLM